MSFEEFNSPEDRIFSIKVYKTSDHIEQLRNNYLGHKKVLNDYGVTNIIYNLNTHPKIYLITLEIEKTGEIVGGVKVHLNNEDIPLPIVKSLGKLDDRIEKIVQGNCAEICGLWNAKKVAGFGISKLLIKFAIAFCIEFKIQTLYSIIAEYTIELMKDFGFTLYSDKKITFSDSYITRALGVLDIGEVIKENLLNQKEILEIHKNKKGEFLSQIKEGQNLKINYNISIPRIISIQNNLSIIDSDFYLNLVNHPELIKVLEWRKFEILIADLLETFGYNIELMQGTKDGGIDVIAFNKNDEFGEHKYLLQAKRWSNKVGIDVVKNVLFNHAHYKVSKSCLATTATFTKGAWNLAEMYKWQLELKDFDAIQSWLKRAWKIKEGN